MKRICEYCGKEYNWEEGQLNWTKNGVGKGGGTYSSKRFCCYKCGKINKAIKISKTYFEKTGYLHPNSNPLSQEKRKINYKNKTGYENQSKDPNVNKKKQQTYFRKTGYLHPSYNPEAKNKRILTYRNKTGFRYSMQNPQVKECAKKTYFKKTGYEYPLQNPHVKNKIRETNLQKYGKESYTQTIYWKNKFKDQNWIDNQQQKINNTKKANNSFNTSKPEEEIYKLLIQKYSSVERQYKSEQYPFNCDFYIPELDLYIEINFHWTHGKEPYNENNQKCIELIEKWKSKNTKFYNKAIEVWTIKDPLKRKVVKENNLNWIEFFNIKEFLEWYEEIK